MSTSVGREKTKKKIKNAPLSRFRENNVRACGACVCRHVVRDSRARASFGRWWRVRLCECGGGDGLSVRPFVRHLPVVRRLMSNVTFDLITFFRAEFFSPINRRRCRFIYHPLVRARQALLDGQHMGNIIIVKMIYYILPRGATVKQTGFESSVRYAFFSFELCTISYHNTHVLVFF